jgi:hypothetical protein
VRRVEIGTPEAIFPEPLQCQLIASEGAPTNKFVFCKSENKGTTSFFLWEAPEPFGHSFSGTDDLPELMVIGGSRSRSGPTLNLSTVEGAPAREYER